MIVTQREREGQRQAEGEAGCMYGEPDVGLDPGSPGSHPGPKAGARPLSHPKIPRKFSLRTEVPNQEIHYLLFNFFAYVRVAFDR